MRDFLLKIISDDDLHAKWINTASYLEYVGARKIIKALNSKEIRLEELKHFSEEAGHAYFFKKIGIENFSSFPKTFEFKNLLGGEAGKEYFQRLDDFVSQTLESRATKLNYLYVTWLIEERAMKVYSLYNNLLIKREFSFNITSLIVEEVNHLSETKTFLIKKTLVLTKILLF